MSFSEQFDKPNKPQISVELRAGDHRVVEASVLRLQKVVDADAGRRSSAAAPDQFAAVVWRFMDGAVHVAAITDIEAG